MERGTSEHSTYKQIFTHKIVHLLAFFSLVYVGIEFTIGGQYDGRLEEGKTEI